MKKILWLILILLFVGCEDQSVKQHITAEDNHENELRYALWSAPSGVFAPQYELGDYDGTIISLAYESLVMVNPMDEYEGILAENWEISEDSKSITFYLRENVKWHDGKPFTAEDVAFSIYYLADPDYTGSMHYLVTPIKGVKAYRERQVSEIDGIEIIDSHTIKLSTNTIYAPILEHIGAVRIFPKHIWQDVKVAEALNNESLLLETIGTGPYILESAVLDQYVTMKRNKDYWGGKPNIEYITFEVMNSDTAKIKMINNELDFMQITTMDPNELNLFEDAGLSIQEVDYNSFQSIVINNEHSILKDVNIRKAIARAIDRELLVDTLIFGHGAIANTVYREEHSAYPGDNQLDFYRYNPDQAIEDMIHKANLKYQNGILYNDNEPIELTLIYPSGNKARELSAPIIQENLDNIGIKVNLEKVEFSELIKRMISGDYDMGLIGTGFDLDPDISRFFSTETIDNGNYSRFSNVELDALLSEGVKNLDNSERAEIYKEVAIILNDQLPVIFLYHWSEGRVLSNRLKGITCYPYNHFYDVHNWYLEQ